MLFNAIALLPEVAYPLPNVNDDAEHVLFIQQASDAWASGQDPLDFWVPQLELGFPQFLYYQNLAHLVVVALGKLTFGLVPLRTLFDLVRYALLVGFPLTVFWSMRRLGFSEVAAAIGAAAGSLLSSGRYGFEYDSYVWRGLGVYTQIFGMHLSFVALATLHRLTTRGTGVAAAALACAALALSHLIYAYMTAITAVVLLLFGLTRANALGRVLRVGAVGALAGVIGAYMWIPFFAQAGYLNISPYLDRAKYDSFGAPTILGWLVSGDLLDHGRLPVLTALLAVGLVAAVIKRTQLLALTLGLFVVWLVLYFGRPTLGPIADLLPLHEGLLFHRFIGGVDLFAILLIGAGGAYLWELARAELSPRRLAAVAAATAILFVPVLAERWSYYGENATWMRITQTAIDADADARTVLDALAAQPPGRSYAGLRTNWGRTLDFGIPFNSVRMYNLLAFHRLDALAPPYRGASLNSDLIFDFNDRDRAMYRLFGVTYVIAPATAPLVDGLVPIVSTRRYVLYRVPSGGYAEYAAVTRTETPTSQLDLFERARAWLRGGAATGWQFARYLYRDRAPAENLGTMADCPRPSVSYARAESSRFDVLASCESDSAMVLKVSYHPNWHVTVDGREVNTFMVSPSYLGFALPAGQHFITAEYRSAPLKDPLFFLGALTALGAIASQVRSPRAQLRRWSQSRIVGLRMLHQSRTRRILE
ncbi:MAG: YfhO family protein [Chloroflexota bacterium]|nr:YfhO family protein [Chloroflexota bacterium]